MGEWVSGILTYQYNADRGFVKELDNGAVFGDNMNESPAKTHRRGRRERRDFL
jgi:hypothetical protein